MSIVAIVNSGGANFTSIKAALDRLLVESIITEDAQTIQKASHVILPGVGRASYSMELLKKYNLLDTIKNLKQPVLGICIGMQILCEYSEEDDIECMGIIPGRFEKIKNAYIIPHMGWNNMKLKKDCTLLNGIGSDEDVYFVHSYCLPGDNTFVVASTEYGGSFASIIQKDNFYGVQFHPEKSGKIGEKLLQNFLSIR